MIIVENRFRNWLGILASIFLGMTFIVAGMGKLFSGVVDFQLLTIPDFWSFLSAKFISTWLLQAELLIGTLLIVGIFEKCVAGFSLLLIAGFITNNIILISMGLGGEPCGCFGMGRQLSVVDSLYLDGVMVGLAVTVLVFYPGRFFNVSPWYWGK